MEEPDYERVRLSEFLAQGTYAQSNLFNLFGLIPRQAFGRLGVVVLTKQTPPTAAAFLKA